MNATKNDLPKLASPAQRALAGAGITRLDQLTKMTETELLQLHGIGPNAITTLRLALQEKGLTFKTDKNK
jgi:DNA-directed RNA polymerase alpha subunit